MRDDSALEQRAVIDNPILPGFHPDPSIARRGDEYFIATSTFEWFPGVTIHRSRDLVHWEALGGALDESSGLDLRGVPDSGGIWAPSLSWHDGRFWLVYSIVWSRSGAYKDIGNFVVTGPEPTGPWSAPVPIGGRGFDASLFHDDDGTHWVVGLRWDPRPERARFAGIEVQRFDPDHGLVGEPTLIHTADHLIEGPNLYRHDGRYHLMLAQGGTGWNHGVSMARSDSLLGPYETDPHFSVLTSRDAPDAPLQKAGHGELVETDDGVFLVHLAARPVRGADGERSCITGRETCLQRVAWNDDGWLRLADDDGMPLEGTLAREHVAAPRMPAGTGAAERGTSDETDATPRPARDDFDAPHLDDTRWLTLRRGHAAWAEAGIRPGWVRLHARHSPTSLFDQAFLAQRVTQHAVRAQTRVDARPTTPAQSASLAAWYDTRGYALARATCDDDGRRIVELIDSDRGSEQRVGDPIDVHDWPQLHLRLEFDGPELRFAASADERSWMPLGAPLDATRLSDDYDTLRFTGAFAGIRVDDFHGGGFTADFDYFELDDRPHARHDSIRADGIRADGSRTPNEKATIR